MIAAKKLTGLRVLFILIGFFGVVIAVNIWFVVEALGTFPGEEVKNPYLEGIHYNALLEERAKEKALGWTADLVGVRRDGDDLLISVIYRDKEGGTLSNLSVKGALKRATHAGDDKDLIFEQVGAAYVARASKARGGLWDLSAIASSTDGGRLEFEKRLTVE
ncbi:MAG TPA: FixH family protein [Parvularculaceae bacterium]|nr:FixH family protein [Parvularculaceae bacterium]